MSGLNDNDKPQADALAFADLAAMLGVDEDVLLHRLADILGKRIASEPAAGVESTDE